MPTPSEPTSPSERTEELRARMRPRVLTGGTVGPSERLALERIQALEVQIAAAHERERSLTELAVRDGNRIAELEGAVDELADLAARTQASEHALFEAEGRAENAVRRADLMEAELMSTRAEVDRLRSRVVELEASLRRALAQVGEAVTARSGDAEDERATRMEDSARRSVELADRLRLKVVDLGSSLRAMVSEMNEATAAELRADEAEEALAAAEQAAIDADRAAEAEGRLEELEDRLAALDARIAALSSSMRPDRDDDTVVDIRDAEAEVEVEVEHEEPELPEAPPEGERGAITPPASRWSDWHST